VKSETEGATFIMNINGDGRKKNPKRRAAVPCSLLEEKRSNLE
jgi:hypothetical protein